MSRYLSIRFDLVWAFSTDGASVQILYHVHKSSCLRTFVPSYEGTFEGTFVIFNSIVTRLVVRQCNPVHYKPRITAIFVNCTHSLASVV